MARFLQASRRALFSSCKTLIIPQRHQHQFFRRANAPPSVFYRHFSLAARHKSPIESNIIRILRNEIEYQSDFAPPHQPDTKFHVFTVEDRPGEQWVTLKGKSVWDEGIKIEATVFDGSTLVPKTTGDSSGKDMRLHISLLVDISKGEGNDLLEFVCSAWPDSLEIQRVYMFRRDGSLPYLGPDFKDMDSELQSAFCEFLKARGVNDDLSVFLHAFMSSKDRTELIKWLGKIKSFVEQ
ncbi:hypothetical protein RJ639_005093 [Escallonia herrerae]|uniref:Mitochondrial glycoprotein n=1 Tax=Escallonia herrerae TaxID=1293975 RepID=A0AA89AXR9_9ASTE|nr:hypothetical protein RJ639_005093 [Escallonia herrerae]